MQISPKRNSFLNLSIYYLRYAALSVLLFFSSKNLKGQNGENHSLSGDIKIPPSVKNLRNDSVFYQFYGRITDSTTGASLSLVAISVQRGEEDQVQVGYSDFEGNYRIEMPARLSGETFTISLTQTHFKDITISSFIPGTEALNFKMKPDPASYRKGHKGLFHRRHVRGRTKMVRGAMF